MVTDDKLHSTNERLKAALEARAQKQQSVDELRRLHEAEFQRQIAEQKALLEAVFAIPDQAERRKLLDDAGLQHVSAAPRPIEPIPVEALRLPRPPADKASIDWLFWKAMPHVKLWQACALAVGLDPDKLKPHPQGWQAGIGVSSPVMIDDRSFRNQEERGRFDKVLRLACAGVGYMDGPIRPRDALVPSHASRKDVAIADVASFLERAGVDISDDLRPLVRDTEREVVKAESAEERQERRVKMCEDDGIVFNGHSLLRLPDGVGRVADKEGVSRQAFSADVKAGLERRQRQKKRGQV